MSFLDMDERLLDLAARTDIVYSPLMDLKSFPDRVDITLVEGAIATDEHLQQIHEIRDRTDVLVAFGDCAVTGNVTALRNPLKTARSVLDRAYGQAMDVTPLTTERQVLPRLLDKVRTIRSCVRVDLYLPGCPPSADVIYDVLTDLVAGRSAAAHNRARLG